MPRNVRVQAGLSTAGCALKVRIPPFVDSNCQRSINSKSAAEIPDNNLLIHLAELRAQKSLDDYRLAQKSLD